MMAYTIAFFGTKPYDESSFNDKNKEFGFEIRYYKGNLNKNNNVIVTSHQAFFTREAMENIALTTLQNIKDFINHKPLLNEVKR